MSDRNFVFAERRVRFVDGGKPARADIARQPHQRWPEPPVNVRNLPVDQPADEHGAVLANMPRQPEEFLPAQMSPPAPRRARSERFAGERRHRAVRRLKHDAVALDETKCLVGRHVTSDDRKYQSRLGVSITNRSMSTARSNR
jgi:hypothetical protein